MPRRPPTRPPLPRGRLGSRLLRAVSVADVSVVLTDSGQATDQLQPTVSALLADTGTAADLLRPAADTPLGDSGTASEQLLVAAQVPLTQAGTAADAITGGQVGTLNHWLVGAPTTSGFTVALRTTGAASTQVRVSTTSDLLTSPQTFGPATPDGNGYSKVTTTGLAAGTDYWYRPLVDGVLAGTVEGPVQTTPTGAGDFSFVFASCHEDSLGDSGAWTRAKARNPDFVVSTGDFGYTDITTNDQAAFRSFYNTYLTTTNVASMIRDVPLIHAWSDHDYDANNGVASSATNPAANAMYRYLFPHYPLVQGTTGIYHTFTYRRVRFIVTDNRSFKSANDAVDDANKTVLGSVQKQWFKDTIAAATEPLIFWVDDQPWTGAAATPDDEWYAYDTERQELAAYIRQSGRRVVILAGDMHAVAADDGRNSPGGIPVFHAAPWRNAASQKGTPYLQGPYPLDASTVEQYGHVQVTDTGSALKVAFTGYDTTDTARVSLTLVYLTDTGTAADSLSAATGTTPKTLADSGTAADRLCHDGGPTGAPDCILDLDNLVGSVVDLWDDPTAPDPAWLTALDPALPTDLRVSFPTPATAPGSGGPTTFQTLVRKIGTGPDPTIAVELWEAGQFRRQLTTATVTSSSGQLVTATMDPVDLAVASGAQAELRVYDAGAIPPVGAGWTLARTETFDVDGTPDSEWGVYTTQFGGGTWPKASHVWQAGGLLHLQYAYDTTGPAGAAWYGAGMMLLTNSSINHQYTLRYRVVCSDPVNVRAHRNVPLSWGQEPPNWPANGEIDWAEGYPLTNPETNIHYPDINGNDTWDQHINTGIDLTQWNTLRVEKDGTTARVYWNDLSTPAWTYNGTLTTLPANPANLVIQTEDRNAGPPSSSFAGQTDEIQVAWLTVATK